VNEGDKKTGLLIRLMMKKIAGKKPCDTMCEMKN